MSQHRIRPAPVKHKEPILIIPHTCPTGGSWIEVFDRSVRLAETEVVAWVCGDEGRFYFVKSWEVGVGGGGGGEAVADFVEERG